MNQTVPAFLICKLMAMVEWITSAKTAEDIRKVSRSLWAQGVGGYQPTLITGPLDRTVEIMKLIEEVRRSPHEDEAEVIGIHLEGPFLSPENQGFIPLISYYNQRRNFLGNIFLFGP